MPTRPWDEEEEEASQFHCSSRNFRLSFLPLSVFLSAGPDPIRGSCTSSVWRIKRSLKSKRTLDPSLCLGILLWCPSCRWRSTICHPSVIEGGGRGGHSTRSSPIRFQEGSRSRSRRRPERGIIFARMNLSFLWGRNKYCHRQYFTSSLIVINWW